MNLPGYSSAPDKARRLRRRTLAYRSVLLPLMLGLAACSVVPIQIFDQSDIAPLRFEGEVHAAGDALREIQTPDLLALTDEMEQFVALHTAHRATPRSRLRSLHSAIKSPAHLHMQYEALAEGTAQDAFERGSANCLSYAHMFIALAREAGLKAKYQWMDVRPQWHRIGERVAVRLHVNVNVQMRDGEEFMVDIDPLSRHEVAGSRLLGDRAGQALYHNNEAMIALSREEPVYAWKHLVRALATEPGMSHLWVNLGAIYRYTGQYEASERAYFRALEVDDHDRSAMNNLVVLYDVTKRPEDKAYWMDKLRHYRERNPYYHSNLGDIAGGNDDWDKAYKHYKRALRLQPEDAQLIYGLGVIEYRRGNFSEASRLVGEAIQAALYESERQNYRTQLEAIKRELSAST